MKPKTTNKSGATKPNDNTVRDTVKPVKLYKDTGRKPTGKDKPVAVVTLANPVTEAANKLTALLAFDPDVVTQFNFDTCTYNVYVADPDKITAYQFFLTRAHKFGNLELKVRLFFVHDGTAEETPSPSWKVTRAGMVEMFCNLFKGGLGVKHTGVVDHTGTPWDFFEFPPMGVSYNADVLYNIHGRNTLLVEDLVKFAFDTGDFAVSSATC